MDKKEYETLKAKIIQEYGKPEYEMHKPINESASKIQAIQTQYRLDNISKARYERKEKEYLQGSNSLKSLASGLTEDQRRVAVSSPVPELFINESYLIPFTDKEKEILKLHYYNLNLTNNELGRKCNVSRQFVTALLDSPAVAILNTKIFDKLLPLEACKSILRLVQHDDKTVTLRVAEHYKLLQSQSTEMNIVSKPIDDPNTLKMLKEMGDELADKYNKNA